MITDALFYSLGILFGGFILYLLNFGTLYMIGIITIVPILHVLFFSLVMGGFRKWASS